MARWASWARCRPPPPLRAAFSCSNYHCDDSYLSIHGYLRIRSYYYAICQIPDTIYRIYRPSILVSRRLYSYRYRAGTLPPSNIYARGMSWASTTYWRLHLLIFRLMFNLSRTATLTCTFWSLFIPHQGRADCGSQNCSIAHAIQLPIPGREFLFLLIAFT